MELLERINSTINVVTDTGEDVVTLLSMDGLISCIPLTDQYGTRPRNFQIEYIVKPLQ